MFSSNTSQVSNDVNYIEDVFSTYLYPGNGSTQTITNGIDLSTKGGLVWVKSRSTAKGHFLYDTARGAQKMLQTNSTAAQVDDGAGGATSGLYAFNTNGFTLGTDYFGEPNQSGANLASWTFRKQPKFFDVVTWTGDGIAGRVIPHNLGSVPGCVIGKRTSTTSDWTVYHRSLNGGTNPDSYQVLLNSTAAQSGPGLFLLVGAPTSTNITLALAFNQIGVTYVAIFFAHNAGGFGLTGTDNVISCGSLVASGGANDINLGFETQFVLLKKSSAADDWYIYDTMRGMPVGNSGAPALEPNLSVAEANQLSVWPTATGFATNGLSGTYIYIAIRRGPMKVPTSGTSVFGTDTVNSTGDGLDPAYRSPFPVDMSLMKNVSNTSAIYAQCRLADGKRLETTSTAAEGGPFTNWIFKFQNGWRQTTTANTSDRSWMFRRAPGFFDVVCYTGTGSARTVNHNLGVAPELMIVKSRNNALDWYVYHADIGNTKYIRLNIVNGAQTSVEPWNNTTPTASVFTTGIGYTNESGYTYVNYLFASCPGVSKVGSYTGTGTTQQINCGFTSGARFIMVKSTSTTGDWIVVDTARGLVSGNDPTLALNSTAAEVTTNDWFDPYSAGFELSSVSGNLANTNGTSYIYLAIA